MKILKPSTILTLVIFATGQIYSQNIDIEVEKEAVLKVMKSYKNAFENLTTEGTFELFAEDSQVFESGGVEGSYANYIEHHIGPELGHFNKFEYSDYEIDVQLDAPYAFTNETYIYTIVIKPDEKGESKTIKKKGVATSILKKIKGKWQIIKTHSSSRNPK
jgi:ketosteroid isomerase-like protein